MRKLFASILFCCIGFGTIGQSASNTIFSNGDKIYIVQESPSTYSYHHTIQKGQSLYALSTIFDISVETLRNFNKLDEKIPLKIGQIIKVPLHEDRLFKGQSLDGLQHGHYIPVYYKAQSKDNLFRISRIYFDQSTEDLFKRNNLSSEIVSLGQEILIGWFPIDASPPTPKEEEFEEYFEEPLTEKPILGNKDFIYSLSNNDEYDNDLDSIAVLNPIPENFNTALLGSIPYTDEILAVKKSEVANWDSTIPDNGTVYVLHKDAIIDSYIEMYNPLLKRSVRAKVIGRIPYGAYANNVSLVLSPRAAKQLGGLDKRFKVEVSALIYKDI